MLLRKFLCNVNDTRALIGLCLLVTSYFTITHIVIVLLLHATYPFFYSSQHLPLLPKAHFPSKLEMIYMGHPVSARRRSLKVKFITRMLLGVCRALHLKHTRIVLQNTVFKGKTSFCASGNVFKFQLFFSIMTYRGGQLKQSPENSIIVNYIIMVTKHEIYKSKWYKKKVTLGNIIKKLQYYLQIEEYVNTVSIGKEKTLGIWSPIYHTIRR